MNLGVKISLFGVVFRLRHTGRQSSDWRKCAASFYNIKYIVYLQQIDKNTFGEAISAEIFYDKNYIINPSTILHDV